MLCGPGTGEKQFQFEFFGKRGGSVTDLPDLISKTILEKGDLPHFILIHAGTNDIAQPQKTTKHVIQQVDSALSGVMDILFDMGVYTSGAHHFHGLIWSDILPRTKWAKFSS